MLPAHPDEAKRRLGGIRPRGRENRERRKVFKLGVEENFLAKTKN